MTKEEVFKKSIDYIQHKLKDILGQVPQSDIDHIKKLFFTKTFCKK